MIIKENHEVVIESYLFAESIKDNIKRDMRNFSFINHKINGDGGFTNVKAPQTDVIISVDDFPSVKLLFRWILNILPYKSRFFNYEILEFWVANYFRGDYTVSHSHHPSSFSFVYFVESPKGSSPLVFTTSGKQIKAKEGRVVIFTGETIHHVPKNKCDGRIVLAGNIDAYPRNPLYRKNLNNDAL
tara:strand:- start:169 stop:726 length:558 start_codon:yes stop_codon:yes gene_type:complete